MLLCSLLLATGVANQDHNSSNPAHNTLSPLDWDGGELFLPGNITELGNLTNAITASSMLGADDILTGILPTDIENLESERRLWTCLKKKKNVCVCLCVCVRACVCVCG